MEFNLTRGIPALGADGRATAESQLVRNVVISTEKPVRSGGGIARAGGAVLAPYLRNPVVMWAHNYKEPPVARATSLQVEPGIGISAQFQFPDPGVYPLADTVRQLWDAGFINAASIGFQPLELQWIDDPEGPAPKPGQRAEQIPVFDRWELYEFSLVSVPRDREALRRALDFCEADGALAGGLQSDNRNLRREVERLNLQLVGSSPVAAAAGTVLAELDLQRFLDGLRAVKEAYHA